MRKRVIIMSRGPRGSVPDWRQNEFDRLALLVLEIVSNGGTITDACEAFEEETKGLRTAASARFKWTVKLSKEYKQQYIEARAHGRRILAEDIVAKRKEKMAHPATSEKEIITQREFLSQILDIGRNVKIMPHDLKKELEELRHKTKKMEQENQELNRRITELEQENAQIKKDAYDAFRVVEIARKGYAGITSPEKVKTIIDKNGLVSVITERDN